MGALAVCSLLGLRADIAWSGIENRAGNVARPAGLRPAQLSPGQRSAAACETGGDGEVDNGRRGSDLLLDGDVVPEASGANCVRPDGAGAPSTLLGGCIFTPEVLCVSMPDTAANACPPRSPQDMVPDGGEGKANRARPRDGADTEACAGMKLFAIEGTMGLQDGTQGAAAGTPGKRAADRARDPFAGQGPAGGEGLCSSSSEAVVREAWPRLGGK